MWVTAGHTMWVTLRGLQCVGNGMWVRYAVRYGGALGAFQGYVTVRYGSALR